VRGERLVAVTTCMACYMLFDDDDPDARAVSIMIIIVIISSTDLRRLPPMTFLAYRYERVKREGMIACCPIRTGRAREKYSYIATPSPSPQTPIRRRTIRFALVVGNDAGRRLLRLLQKLHRGHVVVCYHNKKVRTNSYASAEWRTATEANRGVLRWWNFRPAVTFVSILAIVKVYVATAHGGNPVRGLSGVV
jgi:hypothetical protein